MSVDKQPFCSTIRKNIDIILFTMLVYQPSIEILVLVIIKWLIPKENVEGIEGVNFFDEHPIHLG